MQLPDFAVVILIVVAVIALIYAVFAGIKSFQENRDALKALTEALRVANEHPELEKALDALSRSVPAEVFQQHIDFVEGQIEQALKSLPEDSPLVATLEELRLFLSRVDREVVQSPPPPVETTVSRI